MHTLQPVESVIAVQNLITCKQSHTRTVACSHTARRLSTAAPTVFGGKCKMPQAAVAQGLQRDFRKFFA